MTRMRTFCLAALALLLVAEAAVAQTNLVVWHAYRGKEKDAFEKVVADFNATGKAFKVTTLAVPYDAYADKISAAVPRGKGPDIFIYAQDRLGGWVEAGGTIEPLDFFVEPAVKSRFIPATLDAMTYKGNLYGLPLNVKVVTMIYNKKLVTTPPKDTTELVAIAKKLTDANAGRFGLAYWYSDFYYHSALMNAFGGGVFGTGATPTVNNPANAKSIELLLKWLNVDKIMPAEPSTSLITELFNKGRAGMVFSGPWFLAEIADGVDFGLALLPAVTEAGGQRMRPWMTVEGAYISAPSTHKDEAYEFIAYLSDVAAGKVMALQGRQTPANVKVYDDKAVAADAVLSAFRAQVENAAPMPNLAEMTMVWSPVTTAMNSVVRGTATPQAALDQAQKDVVQRIASLRK